MVLDGLPNNGNTPMSGLPVADAVSVGAAESSEPTGEIKEQSHVFYGNMCKCPRCEARVSEINELSWLPRKSLSDQVGILQLQVQHIEEALFGMPRNS
jgi:hypothetical protein